MDRSLLDRLDLPDRSMDSLDLDDPVLRGLSLDGVLLDSLDQILDLDPSLYTGGPDLTFDPEMPPESKEINRLSNEITLESSRWISYLNNNYGLSND